VTSAAQLPWQANLRLCRRKTTLPLWMSVATSAKPRVSKQARKRRHGDQVLAADVDAAGLPRIARCGTQDSKLGGAPQEQMFAGYLSRPLDPS
jgi:hypothetical protein